MLLKSINYAKQAAKKIVSRILTRNCKLRLAKAVLPESYTSVLINMRAITYQHILAMSVHQKREQLQSECYISLLPSGLPTALMMKDLYGGRVFCDCVENFKVNEHSLSPNYDDIAINIQNYLARGAVNECDGVLTVSNALQKKISSLHSNVFVMKNYRNYKDIPTISPLRSKFNLKKSDKVLFASGNVVIGFESIIKALEKTPPNVHLVAFIRMPVISYRNKITSLIKELGMTGRIHIQDFVEYEQLTEYASGADIGIIVSDIKNPNGAVGLPNRFFDYLASGLPVISPAMPDIVEINKQCNIGKIVDEASSYMSWLEAINKTYSNLESYRENVEYANKQLCWEKQFNDVYEFLGKPSSVTLIGFRDFSLYQRYRRLATSLINLGCSVNLVYHSKHPDNKQMIAAAQNYITRDLKKIGIEKC